MKWNLDDICPIDKFEDLLKEGERSIEATDQWWGKLDPEMKIEEFKKFLEFDEEVGEVFSRLGYLPMLLDSVNQKDAKARLMRAKVESLGLKYNEKNRRIGHWIKGLPVDDKKTLDDKNAKRLFGAVADLEYGLSYSRLAAKHTLKQKEEEIIENKDLTGGSALSDLRGLIEADFRYRVGKKEIKTQGELMALVHSPKAKIRAEAYKALFKEHQKNSDKFFVIYQAMVKDWGFETKIRGYKSPISMRNFANHLPDEVVETLLKTVKDERKVFWRYFEYKAKQLKQKRLSRFDLYAPLNFKSDKKVSYEEAKKLVIDSFEEFSPRFADYGKKVIAEKHIDWELNKNKRSGAFCATVGPKITPYVLLNHTGTLRDVSTLAHELGHAIHSLYANGHYPSSQHANLPLSETASTLGEMVLFEKLLIKETNSVIKKQLLSDKIGDSYATILRQAYFEMFEIEAHNLIKEGTTEAELSNLWHKGLKEQFGKSIKVETVFKNEWMYVSHIFESPFYCYAYSFGELLSLSLYARYKIEGKGFVAKIEKILEAGGSVDPMTVLNEVGIDLRSESFWKDGMKVVESWQKMLEEL